MALVAAVAKLALFTVMGEMPLVAASAWCRPGCCGG